MGNHAPFFLSFLNYLGDNSLMDKIFKTAVMAAQSAGLFIQQSTKDLTCLNVEQKSLHDYVSEVDRGAEKIIVDLIVESFPEHQILGEEYGSQGGVSAEWQWVIDPLDGTTNFLRSIPHYAVSIAVLKNSEIEYAVVYDPAKDDLFVARRGQGAYLNDLPLKVSAASSIKGSLLATGVPFSGNNLNRIDAFTDTMSGLLACQTSGIRRLGAAALDLAYVAAGRYDGFWESNLKVWDIAAGVLLVQEAGGVVSDLAGASEYLKSGNVLAASPNVHPEMLIVCQKCYR